MIVCIRYPWFATSLFEQHDNALLGQPLVLGGYKWQKSPVYSMSQQAAVTGVRVQQPLARACVLCPDGTFMPAQPKRDEQEGQTILSGLLTFTERVLPRPTQPSILYYLDLETARLTGSLTMVREVGRILRDVSGLVPSIGLAGSLFAAYLAAKHAHQGRIRPVDGTQAAKLVSCYPLHQLALPDALAYRLNLFGIVTLGDYAALPIGSIRQQFGEQGERLYALARGTDDRRVDAYEREQVKSWSKVADEPLQDYAHVAHAVAQLAAEATVFLTDRYAIGQTWELRLVLDNERRVFRSRTLETGVNDGAEIERLLLGLLDQMTMGNGVLEVRVSVKMVKPLILKQLSLFDTPQQIDEERQRLENRLVNRHGGKVGHTQALRPQSRLIERRYTWRAV